MSTLNKLMDDNNGYFQDLSDKTQEIVREAILKAAENRNGPDCYISDNECIELIECHHRDGFIPFSHNKGGLVYRNYCDLMSYFGGGYTPKHVGAAKEIDRQIDYSFKMLRGSVFKDHKELLKSKGILEEQLDYHTINELAQNDDSLECIVKDIEEGEHEVLGGSENSIMHEIQFKYEGKNSKGLHVAYVSAAINTEGPYHRSSISWAPNVFCEGSEGIEIKWSANAELKFKLEKALNKVCKAVF